MYEELLKDLRYCVSDNPCGECRYITELCCDTKLMEKAADAIEELSRKYTEERNAAVELTGELASKPRWIPVTEGLPEKKHCVLIFTKNGGTAEGEYDGDGWTQYRWSAKMGADVVTHWMPLPMPPKEETE